MTGYKINGQTTVTVAIPAYESKPINFDVEGNIYPTCSCGLFITDGDPMLVLEGQPMHTNCFVACLESQTVDNAWLTIASQVARHPSMFRAVEIKAVLHNLIRMATTNSKQRTS